MESALRDLSLEGYRRTGGLEHAIQGTGTQPARVWKVTAEQADWNKVGSARELADLKFGRLPPNRRIGSTPLHQNHTKYTGLEGYRRTGGLERRSRCPPVPRVRVWKVTAEQADWNFRIQTEPFCVEGFGRLPPSLCAPISAGRQADWKLFEVRGHVALSGFGRLPPNRRIGTACTPRLPPFLGRVWKVTAEQADWKYTTTPKPHQIHRLGRLPPSRRIGRKSFRSRADFTAGLECSRRRFAHP